MTTVHTRYKNEVEQFFSKLYHYHREKVNCSVCGGEEFAQLFKTEHLTIVRCRCGHVYNREQPIQAKLDQFYNSSQPMATWVNIKANDDVRQMEKFSEAIAFIKQHGVKKIFDLGCGSGKFLEMLRNNDVFASGCDAHMESVRRCKLNQLEVKKQSIDEFIKTDQKYDMVTLWGVLEHIKNPSQYIGKIKDKLNTGGRILVCVPNAESEVVTTIWDKCFTFCPQHLWYFSLRDLKSIFANNDLEIETSWTIESEAAPIIKYKNGFDPYNPLPQWADTKYLNSIAVNTLNKKILKEGKGYKIVAIASAKSHSTRPGQTEQQVH